LEAALPLAALLLQTEVENQFKGEMMVTTFSRRQKGLQPLALLLSTSLIVPPLLVGCGSNNAAPPPIDDTQGGTRSAPPPRMQPPARTGMSTRKKLILLAGAAALYYMYKKHQAKAAQQGQQIQYYRSKNGRIYYREPNNPRQVHWVTPPTQPIQVPEDEASQYSGIEGYNNSGSGRGLEDLFPAG
jgi:hypothetical protein